jgi:hypothetical protein
MMPHRDDRAFEEQGARPGPEEATKDMNEEPLIAEEAVAEVSSNGGLGARETGYCSYCGADLDGSGGLPMRFGERFCSDEHADAFVREARAARIESVATADQTTDMASPGGRASSGWDLKRALKMGACCGLPLLALVFLAGGGGALLGAGAAILPTLALLACPLGMFFMMRAMQSHGKGDNHGADKPAAPKEPKKR